MSGPSAPALLPCSVGLFARQHAGTCQGRGDYLPGTAAALPQPAGACAGGGEDAVLGRDGLPQLCLAAASLTSTGDPVTQDRSYRPAKQLAAPRQAGSVGE